jgi:hypothetical protein
LAGSNYRTATPLRCSKFTSLIHDYFGERVPEKKRERHAEIDRPGSHPLHHPQAQTRLFLTKVSENKKAARIGVLWTLTARGRISRAALQGCPFEASL